MIFWCFRALLRPEVIFSSFIKIGNIDCPKESFRLLKMKSAKKSKLFLISLVRTSESRVALFTQRFLISFKISFFFNESETEFRISTTFLDWNNTETISAFNDGVNHWVLYILTNRICLIVLWNTKTFDNVREKKCFLFH